jgi:hypothetical protein
MATVASDDAELARQVEDVREQQRAPATAIDLRSESRPTPVAALRSTVRPTELSSKT